MISRETRDCSERPPSKLLSGPNQLVTSDIMDDIMDPVSAVTNNPEIQSNNPVTSGRAVRLGELPGGCRPLRCPPTGKRLHQRSFEISRHGYHPREVGENILALTSVALDYLD